MIESRASQLPADVRMEYPFGGNTIDQPSPQKGGEPVKMHYLDEGSGPVVLLLHGNPTWSFYYRKLITRLTAEGFRCIVPDHVGCGLSDKPEHYPYRLERRIDDVERLLDHLGIDAYHLVVHDWGGAIGCGLAARRPEALERLVLLNTAAFRSKRIPWRIALLRPPLLGEAAIRGINAFAGPAAIMAVKSPLAPAVKRGLLWPYRSWGDRVAVWNFVRDIPLRPSHPSYATLEAIEAGLAGLKEKRILIAWGGRDFCFDKHFYERWRSFFPNAEARLHDTCGHYILEDGGEPVLGEIADFLSRQP